MRCPRFSPPAFPRNSTRRAGVRSCCLLPVAYVLRPRAATPERHRVLPIDGDSSVYVRYSLQEVLSTVLAVFLFVRSGS